MVIRLDRSATSVLVVCEHPGCWWRSLGNTAAEARAQGIAHETWCHPEHNQFRHASTQWIADTRRI